jgi:hypothetical protein
MALIPCKVLRPVMKNHSICLWHWSFIIWKNFTTVENKEIAVTGWLYKELYLYIL